MNKLQLSNKAKLLGGAIAGLGASLMTAASSFAQYVPVEPAVDADVQAQAEATIDGIVSGLTANFLVVLAVGGGILVTVMGVYFLIRHFRRIVHA